MTSQLDERPAQVVISSPDRSEFAERRRTGRVAAAVIGGAVLALAAGLVVTVARTDSVRSPVEIDAQVDRSTLEVAAGGLPAHLQEFEARVVAGSFDGGGLPAHLQEFEARVVAGSSEAGEP